MNFWNKLNLPKFISFLLFFWLFHIFCIEFAVVIPSYNNERYYYRNLDSIVHQKTDAHVQIIYINDCSTDRTGQLVDAYVKQYNLQSLITVIHNQKRVGALANLYNAIHQIEDTRVIVVVDGDDWLAYDQVLKRLEEEYQNRDTWLTYGQYMYYPEGVDGICKEIPREIVQTNKFRQFSWVTSHLKTFYAGLFKRIELKDLQHNNEFFPMANDVAMMMPMLEMASRGHISFISDILYIYNHHNILSNHNINRELQVALTRVTYARKAYRPLDELV